MTDFVPNQEQALLWNCLQAFVDRYDYRDRFVLNGAAGTGKTRVIREFLTSERLSYAAVAPSGKAASNWLGGRTLHSWLYGRPHDPLARIKQRAKDERDPERKAQILARIGEMEKDPLHELVWTPKSDQAHPDLIIVEEYGMVGRKDWDALEEKAGKAQIILLGDPNQLPPIGQPGIDLLPDFTLTEIMRQQGSDGWKVAELGRAILKTRDSDELRQLLEAHNSRGQAVSPDVLLTATHSQREKFIRRAVGDLGRTPIKGDHIVAMVNYRDFHNGQVFRVVKATQATHPDGGTEPGYFITAVAIKANADRTRTTVTEWVPAEPFRETRQVEKLKALDYKAPVFTWGQALTVHKSQGSEWGHVHLADDWGAWMWGASKSEGPDKAFRTARSLVYTAVTRAQARFTFGGRM